jgi:hypothetical protein
MKASLPWHRTPAGRIVRFLGSVQLAIPVLVIVAAALAWGTYLESTQSTKIARAAVYGAWWFLGLMVLVSVSLVFAVVTRYPWKRKHVGFITVHTGLILLIIGGFWSLFGRVEGHLTLEEGMTGDAIELDEDVVELVEMNAGAMRTAGTATAPMGPARLTLDGVGVEVVERWANAREEQYVADNGPVAYRALEVALNPTATTGTWVGDEVVSGAPAVLEGLVVRVLPDGASWTPPATPGSEESGFAFVVGQARYPVAAVGQEAFPGWTIESIQRFTHASVSAGTIAEAGDGNENPALDVVITDGRGTRERHTAFSNFPEMIMGRTLEGTGHSAARLLGGAERAGAEALVFYGSVAEPRVGYVSPEGTGMVIEQSGALPWTFQAGTRSVRVLQQFTHAQNASRFTKAPPGAEQRPALVVKTPGSAEPTVLAWKGFAAIAGDGRNLVLRYGPRTAPLPFRVTLKDFRKHDYPGTEMAMAYESDVTIASAERAEAPHLIYMNSPYSQPPWKVYQSGFVGDSISVFSVMKDPGIPLTYAGSIVLCVGLVLTFYSRSLSWGHPGIPIGMTKKEPAHEQAAAVVDCAVVHGVARADVDGAGVA